MQLLMWSVFFIFMNNTGVFVNFSHEKKYVRNGIEYSIFFYKFKCEQCSKIFVKEYYAAKRSIAIKCGSCCKKKPYNLYSPRNNPNEYSMWQDMKRRCNNKKNKSYSSYGGRGIKVCEEWENSFIVFFNWLKDKNYTSGLSIDRINVDGNYSPDNCRLIPKKDQCYNLRTTIWVPVFGEHYSLTQILNMLNIKKYKSLIHYQLKYRGNSFSYCLDYYNLKEIVENFVLENKHTLYIKNKAPFGKLKQ